MLIFTLTADGLLGCWRGGSKLKEFWGPLRVKFEQELRESAAAERRRPATVVRRLDFMGLGVGCVGIVEEWRGVGKQKFRVCEWSGWIVGKHASGNEAEAV